MCRKKTKERKKTQSTPYDAAYKNFFTDPRMVQSLLEGFVQSDFIRDLDFSEMHSVSGSYISADLRERRNDVVWSIGWKNGQKALLHLILEFQSSNDHWMPLRICSYTSLLLLDLIKKGYIEAKSPLPPVFPIVLYTGSQPWTTPLEVHELFGPMPEAVQAYTPSQRYWLVNQGAIPQEQISQGNNLFGQLVLMNRAQTPDEVYSQIEILKSTIKDSSYNELRQAFIVWIKSSLGKKLHCKQNISNANSLEEIQTMLAENLDRWREDCILQGKEEARKEAEEKYRLDKLSIIKSLMITFKKPASEIIDAMGISTEERDMFIHMLQ